MKHFVVGFAVDKAEKKILLIRKNRPEFQKGKLNGVGGKIEPGDGSPNNAMVREFLEETGIRTKPKDWDCYTQLAIPKSISHYDEDVIIFFLWCATDEIWHAKNITDEEVVLITIDALPRYKDLIPNLHWLIPMFLKDTHQYNIEQTQ